MAKSQTFMILEVLSVTKRELSRCLELRQELKRILELLATLEARSSPRASTFDGMPHATGWHDQVGDLAVEIADLRTQADQLRAELEQAQEAVSDYISTIQDAQTRIIFRLRYVHGMLWKEVAYTLGGHNTECSVKNKCCHYIAAHLKSEQ